MKSLILIFSQDFESTTNVVLQWLEYYDQKFYRINTEDHVECNYIKLLGTELRFELIINKKDYIRSSDIKSFWYRKGNVTINKLSKELLSRVSPFQAANEAIYKHLNREIGAIDTIIYNNLENHTISLGKVSNAVNNKIVHFQIARSLGLGIPDSYICTQKADLIQLLRDNPSKQFVVKAISDVTFFEFQENGEDVSYAMYTEVFEQSRIEELSNTFFPSLLQEKLNKRYELRIFYLDGEFYPMAIFSQRDPQTRVDFRKYNRKNPNRRVPFKLPTRISLALRSLMTLLDLNTGSIDMIVTPEFKYYFLEVNPVGQFGMVSSPCNYYLERKIARILSKI